MKNVPESIWTTGSLLRPSAQLRNTALFPSTGLSLPRYYAVSYRGPVADVASPYRAGSRSDIRYPASLREDDEAHTLDGYDTRVRSLRWLVARDGSRESRGTQSNDPYYYASATS